MSGRGPGSSILRPFWTADALKVVGYAMGNRMRTSLVCQAIDMAVKRCPIDRGVTIFHSDRGSQYTSQRFLDHLRSYGLTHDSLVGLGLWGWFFVGIPWCWGCAGTLSGR